MIVFWKRFFLGAKVFFLEVKSDRFFFFEE